ncbi:MAG: PAS domain S-box protein [Chloroflexi bacterium]|nr:PAS domain S-box protein [Chloroflexota bacterium]
MLNSILTRACALIGTPHGQIGLVLPDESAITQRVGQGIYAGYNGTRFEKGEGAIGRIWESGETLAIQDYQDWGNALPEFIKQGIKAFLGVPLKLGDKVIGVLGVSYVEVSRAFTIEQTHFMERFADLASLVIQNTQLYEQLQNELNGRKAIESALRANEERFRKVFEASPVAICITTLEEGRLIEANDAFWKISGFDPHAAIGRTARELNMVESGEKRREFVERLQREGLVYLPEDIFLTPQAEQRIAQAFYQIIEIKGQTCILTMLYDVTKQRQDQLALEAAEARTRALLVAIPDMIIEVSRSGVITDLIPSSAIGVLMPSNQFLGKNLSELLPEKVVSQAMFAIERALETDQLHAFEYGLTGQGDAQFFEARVAAISEAAALIMVREISQRKWIESEREKLITELEEKNAELERFTYAVSHDLKSPLITIRGFLGFVEQAALRGDTSRLKGDIQRITDAVGRMQSLLNELLELSRVGRLMNPYERVPFDEIAREAVNLVQGRLMNTQVEVCIQENLPTVYGDRPRLVEVVQNLVDNAAKFLGDQPKPCIEIGQAGEEEGKPVLFVRDNGIGIKPEYHDRIFGLFDKLNGDTEGTGIGLSLVKRIVEVHHGRIWVESAEGQGSTFFFTMPAEPET